jgi:transcriptional regulator with XRE-family HTH domain
MEDRKKIGRELAQLRDKAGFTQVSMGEALGVSYQTVGRIERGERPPTWRYLKKLAEALHVSVQRLFVLAGMDDGPVVEESELAAMVNASPDLAGAFEYILRKHDQSVLDEIGRYARMVIREKEAEYRESGSAPAPADSGKSN